MKKAALCAVLVALFPACTYLFGRPATYRPPALRHPEEVRDGKTLYMSDCAWCHGAAGQGSPRGPSLITGANGPAMNDFMLSTGRMPINHSAEPAWRRDSVYTPAQINAIVEFAETFDAPGPAIPHPDPARGDLAVGLQAYQENCAACHSTTGIGGAVSSTRGGSPPAGRLKPGLAPSLDDATPQQIAEAMLVGPGSMPVFGRDTFSKEQVDSIVRYVLYLREPQNKGGLPMGKIGPWSEGAAGWIAGLGVLVALIRWVGESSRESHRKSREEQDEAGQR